MYTQPTDEDATQPLWTPTGPAQHSYRPPAGPTPHRRRWLPWAAGVVAFVLGVGVGGSSSQDVEALAAAEAKADTLAGQIEDLKNENADLEDTLDAAQDAVAAAKAREDDLDAREAKLDAREAAQAAAQNTIAPAASSAGRRPASSFPMPNEVGQNLQIAQDDLQQASGDPLFVSFSEDATGAGRGQLLDSGWVVCSQKPAAGQMVPLDYSVDVTFFVVRAGESCP